MTPAETVPGRPPCRGGLWWHADFRRLWVGETVSQFGSTVSRLALPLVAILMLHASTWQVGVLGACETAAFVAVGLPAGAWVERMRLRSVLIVNDLLRAALLAWVPLAGFLGVLSVEQLYVVALVTGVSTVFFDVAYQSYLPQLVGRDLLVEGNAKLQASESVSQIAGPGLGGALIQVLTAPWAVLVDALSFLWSAAWVTRIAVRPPRPEPTADPDLLREIRDGLRFVLGNRMLRAIALCTGTANLFGSATGAVLYVLLARQLRLSPGVIGLLTSTAAVGGLIGALLAGRIAARIGQGPAIWIAMLVAGPCGLVTPFVHRDWTLGLFAVTQIVMWMGVVVYNISQVSFRQALCPPRLLGRMNATMRFLVWGTMPFGALLGGLSGSAIGLRATLLAAAAGQSLAFLPVLLSPLRRARELPAHTEPAAPAAGGLQTAGPQG